MNQNALIHQIQKKIFKLHLLGVKMYWTIDEEKYHVFYHKGRDSLIHG